MANGVVQAGLLTTDSPQAVTIASGAALIAQTFVELASETGTSDDLTTLTFDGLLPGARPLVVLSAKSGHTITLKHGTGNMQFNGAADITLTDSKALLLFWKGTS